MSSTPAAPVASPPVAARGATPHLLAVDGNSLGHRAYHSSRGEAVDGLPVVTGAVVSMLATAWLHGPYDAVLVAFDHRVNQRREDDPRYKANRPPTPPALVDALAELRTHLVRCGLPVVEHPGAEADDVLATAAGRCTALGWRCDLLSSDRDLTACVDDAVRLLRPRARFSDLRVEDRAAVEAAYGVPPERYPDLAALRGDPSDGLDGAVGIGPKTAARLLRDHGSVLGLYAALHRLPPRVEASLRAARDTVERNLLLMAPLPHLQVDVEGAAAAGIDADRVAAVLRELGLSTAARRFHRALTSPPPPSPPASGLEPDGAQAPDAWHDVDRETASGPRPPRLLPTPLGASVEQAALF